MLVVHYENLKRDMIGELQRICQFAALERDRFVIERVAQNATFAAMREREVNLGWQGLWPKDKAFVRRGIVGSFKDEMPKAILDVFMESAAPAVRQLGYYSE
jgi:Sulfotransferase domain